MAPDAGTAARPGIAVVIVNWNGWRDTVEALRSLRASAYPRWTLFIVDNASSDDSIRELEEHAPEARLIRNPDNQGFAGGCNTGIAAALADGAEAVFLLNNDALVRPATLGALVAASRAHPGAVLGAVVLYKGSDQLQFFGSRTDASTGAPEWFRQPGDSAELQSELIPTDFVFGAALFAPACVFERVGLFDNRFFLTYEETDWCYRARVAGSDCLIVRDAVVEHVGSASLGAASSPLQAYFLQRNRLLFWERNVGARRLLRGMKADLRWLRTGAGGASGPTRRALVIAWRDYLLRRFGDCPPVIRRLNADRSA